MTPSEIEKPKILIVDDDETAVQLLRMTLEKRGYRTLSAASGPEALQRLEDVAQEATYWHPLPIDLILLDAMMPDVDGFNICQRVKRDPVLERIPIIMVTALGNASDKVAAVEFGADAYITKPFLPEELGAAIKAKLRVKEREDRLLHQNRELAAVNAVCRAATSTLDPHHVITGSFQALMESTDLAAGALYRCDEAGEQMKLAIQQGVVRPDLRPVPGTTSERTLSPQPYEVGDLEYDPNLAADSVELGSLGSFLSIPLRGGGRLLGMLEVYRRQPDSFREQDRQFFAEIGQRLGVALHHAERFQHAQALLNKGPAARTDGK